MAQGAHSMDEQKCERFLKDTLSLLFERAKSEISPGTTANEMDVAFAQGRRLGYYEALTTLIHQADLFDLPVESLVNFNAEDLLSN